jgi:hypothetical protein
MKYYSRPVGDVSVVELYRLIDGDLLRELIEADNKLGSKNFVLDMRNIRRFEGANAYTILSVVHWAMAEGIRIKFLGIEQVPGFNYSSFAELDFGYQSVSEAIRSFW